MCKGENVMFSKKTKSERNTYGYRRRRVAVTNSKSADEPQRIGHELQGNAVRQRAANGKIKTTDPLK